MAFMDFLLGEGEKTKSRPLYNPQQEQILGTARGGLQQQLPTGLENLRKILGGDEETFESFFAPAPGLGAGPCVPRYNSLRDP